MVKIGLAFQLILYHFAFGKSYGLSVLSFNRSVTAERTCGSPAEGFYETWQDSLPPKDRKLFTCSAKDAKRRHPASYMVDGSNSTFWQSTAGDDSANLTMNLASRLHKSVFVEKVILHLGAYQRPGQMAFFKSTDGGRTYQPWHYYVNFPTECREVFGRAHVSRPYDVETVLCRMYDAYVPLEGNETITFNVKGGRDSNYGQKLQAWMNVTDIKIQFNGLYRKFDKLSSAWHHYSVREFSVMGFCPCNGHGSSCVTNTSTGERVCLCQNNACGLLCDRCCPAFNQYPWKQGKGAPFEVDKTSACKECNCHRHSKRCYYNETVAALNMSLDKDNVYAGGGVCLDCKHNTTGINCEKCMPFFYRPEGKSLTAIDVCSECNCDKRGTKLTFTTPYLDCVKDETSSIQGKRAGDCYCKDYVHDRACNLCRAGYFNLSRENEYGCQDCLCHLPGTKNNSNNCSGDSFGQCPCKNNTVGRDCSLCKNGFFNLQATNIEGCSDCACDKGGSLSPVCNKTTGKCACKSHNIIGQQCRQLMLGYYFPDLHFMKFLVRRSETLVSFKGFVEVPSVANSSSLFRFVISYATSRNITGTIVLKPGERSISSKFKLLGPCPNTCYSLVDKEFPLSLGKWDIYMSCDNLPQNDPYDLSVQSLILLPREFLVPRILGEDAPSFLAKCSVTRNDIGEKKSVQDFCKQHIYTITMGYLDEPLNCSCSSIGSHNNTCEMYAGQCPCKAGVGGKKCNHCQDGFYNFTAHGCTPCDCAAQNRVCDKKSGACRCPPSVKGRTCNKCFPNHWGFNATTGCKACDCDTIGATSPQCNVTKGECHCKIGVSGFKCNFCEDGFTNLSSAGCSTCNCSIAGSTRFICNKTNGNCPCKENVAGKKCDFCKHWTFHLSSSNTRGCLSCHCMGITKNCTGLIGRRIQKKESTSQFSLLTRNGKKTFVTVNVKEVINGVESLLLSGTIGQHEEPVFWRVPYSIISKIGVSSYNGYIGLLLYYERPRQLRTYHVNKNVIIVTSTQSIEANFSTFEANRYSRIRIEMHENNWRFQRTGSRMTRSSFLVALASIRELLISASPFQNSSELYKVSIGNFSYSDVQEDRGRQINVEKCDCGVGYAGFSCERCAPGYRRSNVSVTAPLGECVSCQCNRHTKICDVNTAKCLNCSHNTTGFNCERCVDGFYGHATNGTSRDCTKCPCNPPSAATSRCLQSQNGSISCMNCSTGYEGKQCQRCSAGYYGNPILSIPCQKCNCFNNSFLCNKTTANCLQCMFNTTGNKCQYCRDGYYGDATEQSCKRCVCNMTGSVSNACNRTSGHCLCKRNVVGNQCTKCMNNTYGFNNGTGCKECQCNSIGSTELQCSDLGQCRCKNLSRGLQCNECLNGYYGLPLKPCQKCLCNITGSLNMSCSSIFGQCYCKSGVSGRSCSYCAKQHLNFTRRGCDACPPCTQLLQRRIDQANTQLTSTNKDIQSAQDFISVERNLTETHSRIKETKNSCSTFDKRIRTLQKGVLGLRSNALNNSVGGLDKKANALLSKAAQLKNYSTFTKERFRDIEKRTITAGLSVLGANNSNVDVFRSLETWIRNGNLLSTQISAFLNVTPVSYKQEKLSARVNSTTAEDFLNESFGVTRNVSLQEQGLSHARKKTELQESRLTALSMSYGQLLRNITKLRQALSSLMSALFGLQESDNKTLGAFTNTSYVLVEAEELLNNSSGIIAAAQGALELANSSMYNEWGITYSLEPLKQAAKDLKTSTTNSKLVVSTAVAHSRNLTSWRRLYTDIYQWTSNHGSSAVKAVDGYKLSVLLIKQSITLSEAANRSVQEVDNELQRSDQQNLTDMVKKGYNGSRTMLSNLGKQQNIGKEAEKNFSLARDLSQRTQAQWKTIDTLYKDLEPSFTSLVSAAEPGSMAHSLNVASDKRIRLNNDIYRDAKNVTDGLARIRDVTLEIKTRINGINKSITVGNQVLSEAFFNDEAIALKLNGEETPIQHVNTMTGIIQEYNATMKPLLDTRLQNIRKRIAALKSRISKLNVAVQLNGSEFVTFKPQNGTKSSAFTQIQTDFKSNSSNAMLLSFSNATGQQGDKEDYVTLSIYNARVKFAYGIQGKTYELINWAIDVSNGKWKRAYASRFGNYSRLTVTDLETNFSRTYNTHQLSADLDARLFPSGNASVLLGSSHFPSLMNQSSLFKGYMKDVLVDGERLYFLDNSHTMHRSALCHSWKRESTNDDLSGVTFYGNGFVLHKAVNASFVNSSTVQFVFRTFKQNGTLLALRNTSGVLVYSIALENGKISFQISGAQSRLSMKSLESRYANGKWYQVTVKRSPVFAQLQIILYDSTGLFKGENVTSGKVVGLLSNPSTLIFGNTDNTDIYFSGLVLIAGGSAYLIGPLKYVQDFDFKESVLIQKTFAGCMRLLRITGDNGAHLEPFDILGANTMLQMTGVSKDGCLSKAQMGVHFFQNGYSHLNVAETVVKVVDVLFGALAPSGALLTVFSKNAYLYVGLYHGNIFLEYRNITVEYVVRLYTLQQTLNDGQPHRLKITFSVEMTTIDIDTGRVTQSRKVPFGLEAFPPIESLYVGNIDTSRRTFPLFVPIRFGFQGSVLKFSLNNKEYLSELVIASHLVSFAGVPMPPSVTPTSLPTNPPPTTEPPKCASVSPPLKFASNVDLKGLGPQSYLTLHPEGKPNILSYFRVSFAITLEFRAHSPNGVIFYIAKSPSDNSQYIALELVNGKLHYHFKAGNAVTRVKTTLDYDGGAWNKVYLLRLGSFGAMLCDKTKEYHSQRVSENVNDMNLAFPIFLGGVPTSWNKSTLTNGDESFIGCLRSLALQETSKTFTFDLRTHSISSQSKNVRQCYEKVEPGVHFSGNGFGVYSFSKSFPEAFPIALRFRTTQRSGLLFSLNSTKNGQQVVLEQRQGQMILLVSSTSQSRKQVWVDKNRFGHTNASYALCDNKWHSVVISQESKNFTLTVDGKHSVSSQVGGTFESYDLLTLAGSLTSKKIGFWGCIQTLTFNGRKQDFSGPLRAKALGYGCHSA